MAERQFAFTEKLEPKPDEDDYPPCLLSLNRDLVKFAADLPRLVALQEECQRSYAFPAEEAHSVPHREHITEKDVRKLPGFKAYRKSRRLWTPFFSFWSRSKVQLREFVYVQDREGETDIIVGVRW